MPDIFFNGPAGRLEGKYSPAKDPNAPLALILHPHPLYGGTMNNKVVFSLYKAFSQNGFSTLRFNFRGVGRSEGAYDKGEGELSDATAALDWIQSHARHAKDCWIAGFSFGAWIAMQTLMRRPDVHRFIAISPPANHFDFNFLSPCHVSGLIVQGDQDQTVPLPYVERLITKLESQKGLELQSRIITGANHFFDDKMSELGEALNTYISGCSRN